MAEFNSKYETDHRFIWPCDCYDWHSLRIEWDEVEKDFRWLEISDVYWPHRIRDRIKAAFTVLRGKPHYHTGVILTNENVKEIVEVLSKHGNLE